MRKRLLGLSLFCLAVLLSGVGYLAGAPVVTPAHAADTRAQNTLLDHAVNVVAQRADRMATVDLAAAHTTSRCTNSGALGLSLSCATPASDYTGNIALPFDAGPATLSKL